MQKILPIRSEVKATRTDQLGVPFPHALLGNKGTELFQFIFKLLTLVRRGPVYAVQYARWNFVNRISQTVGDEVDQAEPGATVNRVIPDCSPQQPQFRPFIGPQFLAAFGVAPQVIGKASQPAGTAGYATLVTGKQSRKHSPIEQRPTYDQAQAVVYNLFSD